MTRTRIAAQITAGVAAAYLGVVRPRMLSWGTRGDETTRHLPGDDMVEGPRYRMTHAISIAAGPGEVWQWLIQMGQDRGGLYSYEALERLVGVQIQNADVIHEEWQSLAEGDSIRLLQPDAKVDLRYEVLLLDPHRAMVLVTPGTPHENLSAGLSFGTWAFVLEPEPDGGTRLLCRSRADFGPTILAALANKWLLEPVHAAMQRRMLLGIKERAEGPARRSRGHQLVRAAHPKLDKSP